MSLDAVKAATWTLHVRAERSGIVAAILAGAASRAGVALLLRNLLPVYRILDATRFCLPGLDRCDAIQADLLLLSPDGQLPVLPEARAYVDRVAEAARRDDERLIAHAYVRYLGDLNGGRIMQRRLLASLGDAAADLRTYAYPGPAATARDYRALLDAAVRAGDPQAVAQEARIAFELNIALSDSIQAWSQRAAPS